MSGHRTRTRHAPRPICQSFVLRCVCDRELGCGPWAGKAPLEGVSCTQEMALPGHKIDASRGQWVWKQEPGWSSLASAIMNCCGDRTTRQAGMNTFIFITALLSLEAATELLDPIPDLLPASRVCEGQGSAWTS